MLNETELTAHATFVIRASSTILSTNIQQLLLTDGSPIGDPFAISYNSEDQLLLGEYEIYACTAQYLDNDHVRFTVDYISPAVQQLTIFDPPDGVRFKYTDRSGTSGERELLTFDFPKGELGGIRGFTISFNCGNGSRFMVYINTAGL